jgi:ribosomal-protein-alanine N-acetyltransferase
MLRRDVSAAIAINPSWSEDDYLRQLRHRNCIGMVVEVGLDILGVMLYELHRDRLVLLTIAASPDRPDALAALIYKAVYKVVSHRRLWLEYVVRESDLRIQTANGTWSG